jgi:uncharacterized protein (TIGR02217 family)
MAFDDDRLPTKIELDAVGGPEFRTEVVLTGGGHESRNVVWSAPRHRWDIAPAIQDPADLLLVRAHFFARQGRARGFPFKDFSDFSVTDGVIIASAVGGETSAQLIKVYTSGAVSFVRTITKLVAGTVTAKKNGSPFTVTPNNNTGIITFASLSAADQLTATFEFDVPVRYDVDHLPVSVIEPNIFKIQPIPIVEVRDIA